MNEKWYAIFRQLPYVFLGIVAMVMVVATGVEYYRGTTYVQKWIYYAPWFWIIWGAAVVFSLWQLWTLRKRFSLLFLHLSFVVILGGALVSALTSVHGILPLREGQQSNMFLLENQKIAKFHFNLSLDSFRVEKDARGVASDFVSYVTILDEEKGARNSVHRKEKIYMNHPLDYRGVRFYQTSYDADEKGSVFSVSHDAWGRRVSYVGYLLLFLSCIFVICANFVKRTRGRAWIPLLLSFFAAIGYAAIWGYKDDLLPVLRSPLLVVHVGIIVFSYALFFVLTLRPNRQLLITAVSLLSVGVFLGAYWADISWGRYWSWDPKEVWAMITLIVYALPLHAKALRWFAKERNFNLYLRCAFLAVLVTYFGVNYILGGMHSYA